MRIKKKNHICILCKQSCYGLKYCANCYTHKAQLGRTPWNKDKKTGLVPKTAFKKGIRFNIKGEFKISHGKTYKGNNHEYKSLHYWVYKTLGKPKKCIKCKSNKNVEWANKSHFYFRLPLDWISLCKKCHFAYDHI